MCCKTRGDRPAVYDALHAIDPDLPSARRFWHADDATVRAVTPRAVMDALDAAYATATRMEHWQTLTDEERMELQAAFLRLRTHPDLPASAVEALRSYARNPRPAGPGRKIAAAVGVGLATLTVGLGAATPAEAAPQLPDNIAVQVHKGRCVKDWHMHTAQDATRVQWARNIKKAKKGKTVARTIAPGTRYCAPGKATTPASGVTVKNGVITAVTLPKNPTVADIAALGLNKNSKVAPNLRIPQPKAPAAAAKLADTVTPIRAYPAQVPHMVDKGLYNGGMVQDGTETVVMVEWELRGGTGVVDLGDGTQVPFVNGVARVTTSIGGADFAGGGMTGRITGAGIAPNFGQTDLPASTTQNWSLHYAKDSSGIGNPFGVNANSSVIGPNQDGAVLVNPDYSIR